MCLCLSKWPTTDRMATLRPKPKGQDAKHPSNSTQSRQQAFSGKKPQQGFRN